MGHNQLVKLTRFRNASAIAEHVLKTAYAAKHKCGVYVVH